MCKKIMDELLVKMLELGLGKAPPAPVQGSSFARAATRGSDDDSNSDDDGVVFAEPAPPPRSGATADGETGPKSLVLEQVRVVDIEGGLKVLYPSRTDLVSETFDIVRDFDAMKVK